MQKVFIYQVGKLTIRINFWLLLLFLLMQTLLNELGFWQLNRAKEKQQIIYNISRQDNRVESLLDVSPINIQNYALYQGQLDFDGKSIIYLENQMHQGKVGYHIIQLAKIPKSEQWILVNRGWKIATADRNVLPKAAVLAGSNSVKARLYPITEKGVASDRQQLEQIGSRYRLALIDKNIVSKLENKLSVKILPYQLRLVDKTDELVKDWQWVNMPPQKHLAYAIQWFSLAFALLVISLVAATRKASPTKINDTFKG